MKRKLKCVFCNQDLLKEKYRIDYVLVIVTGYERNSKSKEKKPIHKKCLLKFLIYNRGEIQSLLKERSGSITGLFI